MDIHCRHGVRAYMRCALCEFETEVANLREELTTERERADRAEAERDALRAERDIECDRALRAEARVGYYERELCIGDMRAWVRDPHERADFAVKAISPERVAKVLEERDALRAEMAAVASVAHDGGLANLDSLSALIAVRGLTVGHWIASGSIAEATQRVRAAIDARRAGE